MRKRLFRYFIGLFFILISLAFPKAAKAEPSFKAALSANHLKPAQSVLLTLKIEWPKGEGNYGFAVPEPGLENLSLTRRGESQEFFSRNGQEWSRKTFELEFNPLGPGEATIREFSVTYVDTGTRKQSSFPVSLMRLTVEKAGSPVRRLWVFAAAGMALLAMGAALIIWLIRKKTPPASEPSVSKEAYLARRIKSMIESGGASKENFQAIAAEFRQFVTDYYKTGQPQATEDENIRILKSRDIPFEEFQKVKSILEKIREAKYLPEPSAAGDYKTLQQDILFFIESKKILTSP